MKVEQKGNISCISDTQGDLVSFVMKLTHEYKSFENQHLVIDLLGYENLTNKQVETFLPLSKIHKKAKKSFVIVVDKIDFNAVSENMSVVPTKIEAFDIIEMEDIERDLGF